MVLMSPVSFSLNYSGADVETTSPRSGIDNGTYDSIATDFTKKIIANSRDQELDGRNKISILIENVVITQGSLEIRADRVEADASNGNGNEIITAKGKPASYKQRLEDGSLVIAQANSIKYDVATRTIELIGNAKITQNQSMVSADAISYNMLEEKISANSDKNSAQQVNTVLSFGDQPEDATADNTSTQGSDGELDTDKDESNDNQPIGQSDNGGPINGV